jgi:hypothetical protein
MSKTTMRSLRSNPLEAYRLAWRGEGGTVATISGFLNELAKGGPLRDKWTGGDKPGAMNDFGLDSDQQELIKKAVASGQPSKAILDRISQKEIPALWVK